jgi:GNAT superfamily N-acetyltransferase
MPEGIEIAAYRPEFRAQVVALQERLWSPDPDTNRRYLAWKYDQNPDSADGLIVLALSAGEVVGMRGFMGARWRLGPGPATIPIPAAGDTVVARAFEGRGLLNALNDAARDVYRRRGVRFIMSTSASPPVFLRSRRAGWHSPGPYLTLRRRALRDAGGGRDISSAEILNGLQSMAGQRLSHGSVLRVHAQPLPDEMEGLVASLPPDDRLRRVRNRAYFAWRYRSPLSAYRVLAAYRNEALEAFLVLRRSLAEGSPRVEIADWGASSEDRLCDLLAVLAEATPETALVTWANSLSEPVRRNLQRLGFESVVAARHVRGFARSLLLVATDDAVSPHGYAIAGRSLLTYESWDFRLIDSDGA